MGSLNARDDLFNDTFPVVFFTEKSQTGLNALFSL